MLITMWRHNGTPEAQTLRACWLTRVGFNRILEPRTRGVGSTCEMHKGTWSNDHLYAPGGMEAAAVRAQQQQQQPLLPDVAAGGIQASLTSHLDLSHCCCHIQVVVAAANPKSRWPWVACSKAGLFRGLLQGCKCLLHGTRPCNPGLRGSACRCCWAPKHAPAAAGKDYGTQLGAGLLVELACDLKGVLWDSLEASEAAGTVKAVKHRAVLNQQLSLPPHTWLDTAQGLDGCSEQALA